MTQSICDCIFNGREPVLVHEYIGLAGERFGYMARYETPDGKKEFRPWTWNEATQAWESKGFPEPRPLYGLWRMVGGPKNGAVLLVEGEKCADALARIAIPYVPVSWPNGAASVGKVDFEPLRGRSVVLWPDRDAPGRKAMAKAAEILLGLGCTVKVIIEEGSDGWDAADAIAEGWDWDRIVQWAKPKLKELDVAPEPEPEPEVLSVVAQEKEHDPKEELIPAATTTLWARLGIVRSQNGDGHPFMNTNNVLKIMYSAVLPIWFDEFSYRYRTSIDWKSNNFLGPYRDWDPITDSINFLCWIQEWAGFQMCPKQATDAAAMKYGADNRRNESQEWLGGLKWDGVPRLHNWLHRYCGADDTPYHSRVGELFMRSLAARIMMPGCKVDTMLIFVGPEGRGKSAAAEILGGPWYGILHEDAKDKEFYLKMTGKIILEMAELDTFGRSDARALKRMLSTGIDNVVKKYQNDAHNFPRTSVFIGTSNNVDFLTQDMGLRRYLPVEVGVVERAQLLLDREQLFAEAAQEVRDGKIWHAEHADEANELKRVAEAYRIEDAWEESVADALEYLGTEFVTTSEVMMKIGLPLQHQTAANRRRIVECMRAAGWDTKVVRIGSKTKTGYSPTKETKNGKAQAR